MTGKIMVWTLEEEYGEPEWFGKIDASGANTYGALRLRLEENKMLKWPFEFWNVEDQRQMRKNLKYFNDIFCNVYINRLEVGECDTYKRRKLADELHIVDPVEVPPATDDFVYITNTSDVTPIDPIGTSRTSDRVEMTDGPKGGLKATLISKEIMNWYMESAK